MRKGLTEGFRYFLTPQHLQIIAYIRHWLCLTVKGWEQAQDSDDDPCAGIQITFW